MTPLRITVVDDDPGDVLLLQEGFASWRRPRRLDVCVDGEAAYRRFAALQPGELAPDLVVLDLNLPRRSGREVFQVLRANAALERMPVVVLTTSAGDCDVVAGFDPRLNLYLTKPMRLQAYLQVGRIIESFLEGSWTPAGAGRDAPPR